jgi:beta-lactam-binding protein with PASTA domain
VVAASLETDGTDVSAGGSYFVGLNVNLVVSLGAIPDVSGKTVDEATTILGDKHLVVQSGESSYNDTVPEGDVIAASAAKDGPVREGDTMVLSISRGPEPVQVPDVIGKAWSEAKKILEAANLKLDYNLFADAAPGLFTVTKVTPGVGTSVPKNSTVKIGFSA